MTTPVKKAVNPRDAMLADITVSARATRDSLLEGDAEVLKDLDYEVRTPDGDTAATVVTHEPGDVDADLAAPAPNALQEFEQLPGDEDLNDPIVDAVNKEQNGDKVDNSGDLNNTRIVERDGVSYLRVEINGLMTEMPYDDVVAQLNLAPAALEVIKPADVVAEPDTALEEALTEAFTTLVNKGDVESAVASTLPAIKAAAAPTDEVTMQRIANEATAVARRADKVDAAWDMFKNDPKYAKFAESPKLRDWLSKETVDVQADTAFMEINQESFLGVFKEAGDRIRAQISDVVVTPELDPQAEVVADAERKIEKKRQMPSAVSSRTVRQSAPVDKTPPTNSQIISGMKKARGQKF